MKKIATHNSATGEPSHGIISKIFRPFARCQRLNLAEQHAAGCRVFDLRVRFTRHDEPYFCHGLWKADPDDFFDTLATLNEMAGDTPEKTYIMLAYEGRMNVSTYYRLDHLAALINGKTYPNLTLIQAAFKKPRWRVVWSADEQPPVEQCYEKLTWPNPRLLLPVPRLWAHVNGREEFNTETFKMVDFL